MISLFRKLLSRKAPVSRQDEAQRRLAQLVRQTADSYEVRRYREARAAALKGHALHRQKMEAQGW